MSKTLLEKMFLKPAYTATFLHTPKELQSDLNQKIKFDDFLNGPYNFILGFYSKKEELEKEVDKLKKSLETNGLLWIAYPKGKTLQTDLNRDILHEIAKEYGLDGVSLISLNATWSAMRFKKI